jgi:hypothetical protein
MNRTAGIKEKNFIFAPIVNLMRHSYCWMKIENIYVLDIGHVAPFIVAEVGAVV